MSSTDTSPEPSTADGSAGTLPVMPSFWAISTNFSGVISSMIWANTVLADSHVACSTVSFPRSFSS